MTQECDHCETSERAYADIAPLLSALATELGKTPEELVIYDPYYCQGSTVARLASLGFPRVYNRKEDFYEVGQARTDDRRQFGVGAVSSLFFRLQYRKRA